MNNAPTEPFPLQDAVSVRAVPLGNILTQAATFVPNALQEPSQRFLAALNVGNVQQAPSLLQVAASVAIVWLESFLRQEATTVRSVLQEKSRWSQVALHVKHVQLEPMKLTRSSATCASRAPLQLRVVELAGHAMLAVLLRIL